MDTLPINIFYAYAKEDEQFRIQLNKHLSSLKREGIISDWHFRKLTGGDEWRKEIDHQLNNAQVILLLISSDFISSDYCYDVEMKTALQLHNSQKARVIPVILRPVDWQTSPFSKLQALPTDGKAVTEWPNQDQAFLDIAQGIRKACHKLLDLNNSDTQVSSVSQNTSPSFKLQTKNLYCVRCGAIPSEPTTCTGLDPYHDFQPYSGKLYCVRCGAIPGRSTTCTGLDPYHDFRPYSGKLYCVSCGATPGRPTTCTGVDPFHVFQPYSGKLYCIRCGATPGEPTTCTGLDPFHDFQPHS